MNRVQSPDNSDAGIESLIQAKGLTAPRVTPADIEAAIASEHYFTAADGDRGSQDDLMYEPPAALRLLTFCVLVLRNGFTVTGESACASPENFDAEVGRRIARENAKQKLWPLLGYQLRDRLHNAPRMAAAVAQLETSAEVCDNNAPVHEAEGNHEQAYLSRSNAESYRAAIAALG